ncbi:DUF3164 family protein [Weeksella virosa]|uniref:DUF3164 family protein n=1 Tax=Weeksella virosa (strain ATCC 43766 / DSM 16922 / JCM 21250 / CCUG 30538 / CDC 9751 / IAM 14551 / NBRC 16016 / NCTC 11634 / CL345/78) TaxID=865938 RepID=F0NX86_WEEVC|nr:DUF3164 family protein [Weeksella virosa]ADX66860.1 hypothetical protein Weevi_0134 [Weeksella virosa DSM 16922]MDK7675078.1 DUF3164 family protein [Weeksella virosa]VEH63416.1 Uncharacterised protein [Weeksella virosa]
MANINLGDLTAEQKKQLAEQLAAEKLAEKEQRKQNLATLEEMAKEQLPSVIEQLTKASEALQSAKEFAFRSFEQYLKLKIETLGITSVQKSHTINVDGRKIIIGYRVTDGYDDNAGYGLALVHKFLGSLAKDEESAKLIKSINRLLQKNAKGDLDSKKVLELAKIANEDFPETEFQEGVEMIQGAYKPRMSKWFIEATQTDGQGVERSIPLSITSVNLPVDLDLSFLLPKDE